MAVPEEPPKGYKHWFNLYNDCSGLFTAFWYPTRAKEKEDILVLSTGLVKRCRYWIHGILV